MVERTGSPARRRPRDRRALLIAAAFAAAVGSASGCLERRAEPEPVVDNRCSTCHGDPSRSGDALLRAAPPRDLSGASDPSYPGVGAHSIHLSASSTHGAFACTECHVVPRTTDAPGHADSARPAELVFGALARTGNHDPSYDAVARTCTDSWCHRDARPLWTAPRDSAAACGSCHGLPPKAPHPQSQRCYACHADVIDANNHFVNPALHVDGMVEFQFGKCSLCHGSDQSPAPPPDTSGEQSPSAVGVGAHSVHLAGGVFSRPLACAECHQLPDSAAPEKHVVGGPAPVTLSGVASSAGRSPSWDHASLTCSNGWCHSPGADASRSSPRWTDNVSLTCTGCHGAPPAAPHPQMSACSICHSAVVGSDDMTIVDRARHVDGNVDVSVPENCSTCHGNAQNPAPPLDLSGSSDTASAGVGAHQTHVAGTGNSRRVPCGECHVVPNDVLSPGHLDSARPAELSFSGTALAFGAVPAYANGACGNTPCHGAVFPDGHASGATSPSPVWTTVDGSQNACGACHSLPPPRPHPYQSDCSQCHKDIAPGNLTFLRPELHIDGVVTFELP